MKDFVFIPVFVVLLGGLIWGGTELGFRINKHFSPKYEQVRYTTFKESQSFNDGKAEWLQRLRLEYETADSSHKEAIRATVLLETSNYDVNRLPPQLAVWVGSLSR